MEIFKEIKFLRAGGPVSKLIYVVPKNVKQIKNSPHQAVAFWHFNTLRIKRSLKIPSYKFGGRVGLWNHLKRSMNQMTSFFFIVMVLGYTFKNSEGEIIWIIEFYNQLIMCE